jgi:hypothetical protein
MLINQAQTKSQPLWKKNMEIQAGCFKASLNYTKALNINNNSLSNRLYLTHINDVLPTYGA